MRRSGSGSSGIALSDFDKEVDAIWADCLKDVHRKPVIPQSTIVVSQFDMETDAVWTMYVDDTHLGEFSLLDHLEVERSRFPVTQEFMVAAIVAERRGEAPPHPAKQYFADALYASIERLVGMIASKYSVNCAEPHDDLAQDCFSRIWKKLHKYDPNKSKFTTWVWRLCSNLLNRKYRRSQRRRWNETVQPAEDMERKAVENKHYDSVLSGEFSNAVRELGARYPRWKRFVYALLGDPCAGTVPSGICVAHAARIAGIGKGTATNFYHQRVQPFLRKRFVGYGIASHQNIVASPELGTGV